MTSLKKIIPSLLILSIVFVTSCGSRDTENCNDCIARQNHYYEALLDNNCNTTITQEAANKIYTDCADASPQVKINLIQQACNNNTTPVITCDPY